MAGMEALGRLCNTVPVLGSGNTPIKLRGASGVMVVVNGATAVATVNERSSFAGGDTAIAVIKNIYWMIPTAGTAVWNKLGTNFAAPISTYTHGTTAGLTTAVISVFHVLTSQLSDPNNYLNVVITGSGSGYLVTYDLVAQRGPANLEILGA